MIIERLFSDQFSCSPLQPEKKSASAPRNARVSDDNPRHSELPLITQCLLKYPQSPLAAVEALRAGLIGKRTEMSSCDFW